MQTEVTWKQHERSSAKIYKDSDRMQIRFQLTITPHVVARRRMALIMPWLYARHNIQINNYLLLFLTRPILLCAPIQTHTYIWVRSNPRAHTHTFIQTDICQIVCIERDAYYLWMNCYEMTVRSSSIISNGRREVCLYNPNMYRHLYKYIWHKCNQCYAFCNIFLQYSIQYAYIYSI